MRIGASIIICMASSSMVLSAGQLLKEIQNSDKIWTTELLAKGLFAECRSGGRIFSQKEVLAWDKLLDSSGTIVSDGSLVTGIRVREIALACIEEMTGENFYPILGSCAKTRETVSFCKDSDVQRFSITEIDPNDIPSIHKSVRIWINANTHKIGK